jgi:hypothetical protein
MPRPATTTSLPLPLQFLAAWIATWLGEHQARMIEYQRAENAALLERLGKHRLRLTDGERRRLAKLGKALGRKALNFIIGMRPDRCSIVFGDRTGLSRCLR